MMNKQEQPESAYERGIRVGHEHAKARKATHGIYRAFSFSVSDYALGYQKGWNRYVKEVKRKGE